MTAPTAVPARLAGDELAPERLARVALNRLFEPGDLRVGRLVGTLGAVALHRSLLEGRDAHGVRHDAAQRLADLDPVGELDRATRLGLRFVIPGDDEWPTRVDDLAHVEPVHDRAGIPLGLWVRGPLRLDRLADSVAVVGARSATSYGAGAAGEIGCTLARAGVSVVSGAAFGIDQAAHRGALSGGGPTVAVLACGADRVYPAAHRDLVTYIAEHGAVVSEAAPGCAPMRVRFLSRNRVIAALTGATVLVEAAVRSGALNTANWAERLGRPVLGVPGPVTSAQSAGVHHFLRTGGGQLVTCGADVLEVVGRAGEHTRPDPRADVRPRDRVDAHEAQVLDAVPHSRPARTAAVARTAGVGVEQVDATLRRLERRDLVVRVEGGWRLGDQALT